jgi:hypothetical protein
VCGGWAIDLFLDEVTRPHEDVEVGIFRHHQEALWSHLAGWGLLKCARPGAWDGWRQGEQLEPPIHQVLARPPGSGAAPEPWEPGDEELQFFLHEVRGGTWFSRRNPAVTRPVRELYASSRSGILVVAPEVQLLYKAKHHVDKDEHDFRTTVGRLGAEQRQWLKEALELVHPGDPWLEELE